jgi:hypothetical protein
MKRQALERAAGIAVLTLLLVSVQEVRSGPAFPGPSKMGWTVELTVWAKGTYGLEGRSKASGRYALKMTWTGGLDWDGDDYILVKGASKLAEWTAEESAAGPGGILVLTTDDFDETPELNVAYVLKHGDGLHLSFIVRGFDVPLSFSADNAFYLNLPASAENEEYPGGVHYNLYVKTGSNVVVLDDPAQVDGTQERTFRWSWIRRTAAAGKNQGYFETNRHEAEVTVVVRPAGVPASFPRPRSADQARGWNLS